VRPIEHFIIAFLPAVGYVLVRDLSLPASGLVFAVFVGSQFPDLIDKPLAHYFGLLPSGRVFMHSLPFALPVGICVLAYGVWTNRPRLAGGFVLAQLLHLYADNRGPLRAGSIPSDLLWPFVAPQPRPAVPYWAGPDGINILLWTAFSGVVLSITAAVMVRDVGIQIQARKRTSQ